MFDKLKEKLISLKSDPIRLICYIWYWIQQGWIRFWWYQIQWSWIRCQPHQMRYCWIPCQWYGIQRNKVLYLFIADRWIQQDWIQNHWYRTDLECEHSLGHHEQWDLREKVLQTGRCTKGNLVGFHWNGNGLLWSCGLGLLGLGPRGLGILGPPARSDPAFSDQKNLVSPYIENIFL